MQVPNKTIRGRVHAPDGSLTAQPGERHNTTTSAATASLGYQTSSMASGSFAYLLDGLGYTYMSLAVCLTAPIFTGGRLATWIRRIAIANGPIALAVFLAYVFNSLVLGLGALLVLLVPVYGILVAVYFYKANPTPIQRP